MFLGHGYVVLEDPFSTTHRSCPYTFFWAAQQCAVKKRHGPPLCGTSGAQNNLLLLGPVPYTSLLDWMKDLLSAHYFESHTAKINYKWIF